MRRNFLSGNESWMVSLKHLLALSLTLALTTDQVAGASPPAATSRLSDDDQLTQLIQHHSNDREHGLDRHRRSILTPLGKRITSSLVAELGKRPRELYSFGIGKRSISANEMEEFLAEEAEKHKHEEPQMNNDQEEDDEEEGSRMYKRDPYSFGLGKRTPADNAYAFGMGKREYGFGLGRKRDPYAFGLGKRDPYSFGLGKRDPYAFGLGKRDPYAFGLGKRSPYSFGLGKRDPYSFGLGKRDPYSFGLGKRSNH